MPSQLASNSPISPIKGHERSYIRQQILWTVEAIKKQIKIANPSQGGVPAGAENWQLTKRKMDEITSHLPLGSHAWQMTFGKWMVQEPGRWGVCQDFAAATYYMLVRNIGDTLIDKGYVLKVFWSSTHAYVVVEPRGNYSSDLNDVYDYAWLVDGWYFNDPLQRPVTKINKATSNFKHNMFFSGLADARLMCVFHQKVNPYEL